MSPRKVLNNKGITLVELIVAAVVISVVVGYAAARMVAPARTILNDRVEIIASELMLAKSNAISEAKDTKFFFGETGTPLRAWYAAIHVPTGSNPPTPPANLVNETEKEIRFGTGDAISGPFGEPINPLAPMPMPLGSITCTANNTCNLGGEVSVTYYFTYTNRPDLVSAITISRNGLIRPWKYNPENRSWY